MTDRAVSPNYGARRNNARPDMIVLHYTGMASATAAQARLCDPAAQVSAHYLVDLDGDVTALVPEAARAWHAGVSGWGAITDINSHSIGIEIVNPGHDLDYHPFPEPQMQALEGLLGPIMRRWSIPPERVVGHACIAPGRKIDPGEKFDWQRLARLGLAIWHPGRPNGARSTHPEPERFLRAARRFGYPGTQDVQNLNLIWRSFAMRFRPFEANDSLSAAGTAHLEILAECWPVRS